MHLRKTTVALCFLLSLFLVIVACTKSANTVAEDQLAKYLNLPSEPYNYALQTLPAYFNTLPPGQNNTPLTNATTNWGATLGRVLFYDKTLSINNKISCASCHKQQDGFSDDIVFSKGFNDGFTTRNSMSLVNAGYYPNGTFFWDQRAATLEIQTLMPVQHPVEMGMILDTLVKRLSAQPYYATLFTNAFGSAAITSDKVSKALAQFVRSIVSYQSKYDVGRQAIPANQPPGATDFSNFTPQENRGKQIFFGPIGNCAACHGTETFTAPGPKNNGLELISVDKGLGEVNNAAATVGLFKVPSLKSIALSAPYMHDGRFATLNDVVEHYSSGIKAHVNLSPELRLPNGQPRNANLTQQDKDALVAFLKTLTDTNLATDVKFSNPFKL